LVAFCSVAAFFGTCLMLLQQAVPIYIYLPIQLHWNTAVATATLEDSRYMLRPLNTAVATATMEYSRNAQKIIFLRSSSVRFVAVYLLTF
jgi:hypothetical protein